jgi:hypothetical protein
MKKHYLLPLRQAACFILISLLLQNCGGSFDLPLEGKEGSTEAIEQIEGQLSIMGAEEEEINSLPTIMPELWQEIFSYLNLDDVLAARAVSSDWNELITGFRKAGVVGVKNKPSHIIETRSWIKKKKIDFRNNKKSSQLTPAKIPSFAFYYLMGHVRSLPQSFWPYLQQTNVHTVGLSHNQVGAQGAMELAKHLQGTHVHTLALGSNEIG